MANFVKLMAYMLNIENHSLKDEIFLYFDKDEDGLVDFEEWVRGLDIVERGTFRQKCAYCYEVYDLYGL